jgi:hypothetical protein
MYRVALFAALLASGLTLTMAAASPALAQKGDPLPKRETYLCPHSDATAIDCYLDAVDHLYTMCRVTKSIEILEFGYEKSDEGVNGAKTQYCIDKHNLTMKQTYDAALKQAAKNKGVTEALHSLHDYWRSSLVALKWVPGESDEQYKARTAEPYGVFRQRALLVRQAMAAAPPEEKAPAKGEKAPAKAKGPPAKTAKSPEQPKASN